jgi:hypothetical protein
MGYSYTWNGVHLKRGCENLTSVVRWIHWIFSALEEVNLFFTLMVRSTVMVDIVFACFIFCTFYWRWRNPTTIYFLSSLSYVVRSEIIYYDILQYNNHQKTSSQKKYRNVFHDLAGRKFRWLFPAYTHAKSKKRQKPWVLNDFFFRIHNFNYQNPKTQKTERNLFGPNPSSSP